MAFDLSRASRSFFILLATLIFGQSAVRQSVEVSGESCTLPRLFLTGAPWSAVFLAALLAAGRPTFFFVSAWPTFESGARVARALAAVAAVVAADFLRDVAMSSVL